MFKFHFQRLPIIFRAVFPAITIKYSSSIVFANWLELLHNFVESADVFIAVAWCLDSLFRLPSSKLVSGILNMTAMHVK